MSAQRIGAAVDVGSNSVHLLVARLRRDSCEPLRDESVLLGLGDVVDAEGELPPPAQAELLEALARYVKLAQLDGASTVSLVATEPLRRAANGRAVAAEISRRLGVPLHLLSEQQEGELTYLGVTGGRPSSKTRLVVDIGGGSSEVIVGAPGHRPNVTSLASGSARLSAGIVAHDPPTSAELDSLLGAARVLVAGLPDAAPVLATFVGGTATNLARLAPLSRDGLALAYRALARLTAADISRRYGVNLRRARQLPAGAALVDALLARFAIDEAVVSDASLRDGAIIAADRLGEHWLEGLPDLLGPVASSASG